jgi:hypothetical protein
MELFAVISFIGTLVLLAVHVLDYALESQRRPMSVLHMPSDEFPTDGAPLPFDTLSQYDPSGVGEGGSAP